MHERFTHRSLFLLIQEYFDCFEDKNIKRAKITRLNIVYTNMPYMIKTTLDTSFLDF